MGDREYDVVIIGSGFGGSVSAMRLIEKGYSVAVLEAGRRFKDNDFPKTSWRIHKFLFAPKLGLRGIQRIHALPDVLVLWALVLAAAHLSTQTLCINHQILTLKINNGHR